MRVACRRQVVSWEQPARTSAEKVGQGKGDDRVKFPEFHSSVGVLGMERLPRLVNVIGHFTATQFFGMHVMRFKGCHALHRGHCDPPEEPVMTRDVARSEAHRRGTCPLANVIGARIAQALLTSDGPARREATSLRRGMTSPFLRPLLRRPLGLCRGSGGHSGSISRISPLASSRTAPMLMPAARAGASIGRTSGPRAAAAALAREALRLLVRVRHRGGKTTSRRGTAALRKTCMMRSRPSTGRTAGRLLTEFEGEPTRLGGGSALLLLAPAGTRPSQLVGRLACLGPHLAAAAAPANAVACTIRARRATWGIPLGTASAGPRHAWISRTPFLQGHSLTTPSVSRRRRGRFLLKSMYLRPSASPRCGDG